MKLLKTKIKKIIRKGKLEFYIMPIYFYSVFILKMGFGLIRVLRGSILIKKTGGKSKIQPKVLQLPITNYCNLNCKTCNVPHSTKNDFELEDLSNVLNNKLFTEIKSVGVNGGEPFIKNNLEEYINVILKLPKLNQIHIISNGILTERILEKLRKIYSLCNEKGVSLNITFSLDGYANTHDLIRGVRGAFEKTVRTIKSIQENQNIYCDNISIICTVSKFNITELNELDSFIKLNKLPSVEYQLAVSHNRLDNRDKVIDFSIAHDEHAKMLAKEFFFSKYNETRNKKYFYILEFLNNDFKGRMMSCPWQEGAVTIDAGGNLCYCAVESNSIGNIKEIDAFSTFFSEQNLEYRHEIVTSKCDTCIHYSDSKIYFSSYYKASLYDLKKAVWKYKYLRGGRI